MSKLKKFFSQFSVVLNIHYICVGGKLLGCCQWKFAAVEKPAKQEPTNRLAIPLVIAPNPLPGGVSSNLQRLNASLLLEDLN